MQRIGSLVTVAQTLVVVSICDNGFASDPPVLLEIVGKYTSDRAGTAIAGLGDVDGDGVPDLAIGVPGDSSIWPVLGHGSVLVASGKTGKTIHYLIAPAPSVDYGNTVAAAGDLDLDGFVDILVGTPSNTVTSYENGSAYAYSGSTGSLLFQRDGTAMFDRLGRAIVGIGDVNQDGTDDVAIGVPGSDAVQIDFGAVLLVRGQDGATIATIGGLSGNSDFGIAIAGPGDTDGDGIPEILISAPRESPLAPNGGAVRLFAGKDLSIRQAWFGGVMNEVLGISLHKIPDLDGDGRMDAIMGSYGGVMQPGRVQVCSTANGAALVDLTGATAGSLFGLSCGPLADQDGDGRPEILAGAPLADGGGFKSGSAFVLSTSGGGKTVSEVSDFAPSQMFGFAIADLGDIDLDGRSDYAVGQPGFDSVFSGAGRVIVYGGLPVFVNSIGSGCPGSGEVIPALQSEASPPLGAPFAFHIKSAMGNSLALLAASKSGSVHAQPNGCMVYLGTPVSVMLPVPLGGYGPGGGSATVWGQIPPNALAGAAFEVQAFILDPGAFGGYCATNALEVVLP